jgi:hypothetical protein
MRYKSYRFLVNAALILIVTGCAAPAMEKKDVGALSVYKQKTLDELGAFEFEKRMYVFNTIDGIANQLVKSPSYSVVRKEGSRKIFKDFTILELVDRDLDGKAEQFSYESEKRQKTNEFGFMFDLNRDGKVDYVVFNGGLAFTRDFKKGAWFNYHWIDSNYDGKIDIAVFNNYISLDGDSFFDEGISGWVYDTNFDGLIDKAEYLGDNFQQPVEKRGGEFFVLKTFLGKIEVDNFGISDTILSDLNSVMR